MPTIAQLTSAGQPFPDYATMAENQFRLDYLADHERYVPPFRDKRVPCSNPACAAVCEDTYCSPVCEAADNAVIADMAARWEASMLQHGCQRTRYYASREENATVLLGKKHLVAQQHARDGESLAALVCGYRNV